MLNIVWSLLVAGSVICSLLLGNTESLSAAMVDSAAEAMELLLKLAGILALWSGIMKIAQESGLTALFARLFAPLLRLLFPRLDRDSEAFGLITMNITANLLGLGNAATPAGIAAVKAIAADDGRNSRRNITLLVVLNTASIQLIPTTVGALRAKFGSQSPFDITLPTLAVSLVSAVCGCVVVWVLGSGRRKNADR